jgi:glycosyltransferase involved in cell wall biosynthesis
MNKFYILIVALFVLLILLAIKPLRLFLQNTVGSLAYHIYREIVYVFRPFYKGKLPKFILDENYEEYQKWASDRERKKSMPNIAVVKPSRAKYTETFIANKIFGLKNKGYYVHELYGGYFPNAAEHYGHLLSGNGVVLAGYNLMENLFSLPHGYFLKRAFIKYLERFKIQLVFAEYGTVGVEIYEMCKQAEVPLVVTFRGYDIHHFNVFDQNREGYKHMMEYCSAIICVSNDIKQKISSAFDVAKKLLYLPSPINLNLFTYSDHSSCANVFLYVGRFSETKSPHLVLLSFVEVLKEMPNSKLVMIGKDGGGDLYEACLILAKALGIEGKVVFKGIKNPEEVYQEMKNARVFVQHSLTTPLHGDREGTPVSVREAMACGLPVVSTKHAGIEEVITTGVDGILVEEYDYMAMAVEMIRVCKNDELVAVLGRNASETIRNNPLVKNNTENLVRIIKMHAKQY